MIQNTQILEHLKNCGSITPKEALDKYGIMRLGARIYDLKQMGVDISKNMVDGVNRLGHPTKYAQYYLTTMRREDE